MEKEERGRGGGIRRAEEGVRKKSRKEVVCAAHCGTE